MTFITSPPIGFPDDQEQPQWQSPILISETRTLGVSGTHTYTPVKVANWQSVQVAVSASANSGNIELTWFADAALTNSLGTQIVAFSVVASANFIAPNIGPYLSVLVQGDTTGLTYTVYINATNRSAPPWSPTGGSLLMAFDNVNLAGGGTQTAASQGVYAGPAFVSLLTAANPWDVTLAYFDLTGLEHICYYHNVAIGDTAKPYNDLLIVPAFPLHVKFHNASGGAAGVWFKLIADSWH